MISMTDRLMVQSPEFRAMVSGYVRLVQPAMVSYSNPSTIDKPGLALMAVVDYQDRPRMLLHKLKYYLTEYVRWTLDDFGLYHWVRFKEHPDVRTWITENHDTIRSLAVPGVGATKFQKLLALFMIPWGAEPPEVVTYRTEDSMLPPATNVGVFAAHLPPINQTRLLSAPAEFNVVKKWATLVTSTEPGETSMDFVARTDYKDALATYVLAIAEA
jgi:hypothetical protein